MMMALSPISPVSWQTVAVRTRSVKKRLRARVEEMLLDAESYALGQHLQLSSSSPTTKLDEACRYLLENTYTKLSYLQVYQQDAWRELNAVLTVDDMAQLGLSLDGGQSNPKALQEVEQYIALRANRYRSVF